MFVNDYAVHALAFFESISGVLGVGVFLILQALSRKGPVKLGVGGGPFNRPPGGIPMAKAMKAAA
jgi:hypothetical protein